MSKLVSSVRDLGVQFLDNDVHIKGHDGSTSILLPDGDTIWVFGDTIEVAVEDLHKSSIKGSPSNTAALVPMQDLSDGIQGHRYFKTPDGEHPRQLVEIFPDEDPVRKRLWAIHGVPLNSKLYLYYHEIMLDMARTVYDTFKIEGMGIARGSLKDFQFERLRAPDGTTAFWKGDQPGFGVSTQQLDGYLYLLGSQNFDMYLARVPLAELENLNAYEYLVAAPTLKLPDVEPKWEPDFRPTAPLFGDVPNEMSVSYNAYLKKFIALHTFRTEDKLVIRSAPAIYGPWSDVEVFHQPEKTQPDTFFYAGKEHPEFAREGGKVLYMTYINSLFYMPTLVEITLV